MKFLFSIFSFILIQSVSAQISETTQTTDVNTEVVQASVVFEKDSSAVNLYIEFLVEEGWIVYDSIQGEGPIPLSITSLVVENVEVVRVKKPKLKSKFDDVFEVSLNYFSETVVYKVEYRIIDPLKPIKIKGEFEFMSCNLTSGMCLSPTVKTFSFSK